jgi:hypothetical protein
MRGAKPGPQSAESRYLWHENAHGPGDGFCGECDLPGRVGGQVADRSTSVLTCELGL